MDFNKGVKCKMLKEEDLLKTLSKHCINEIDKMKCNEAFVKLQNIVNELHYVLVCEYGKELRNKKNENLYLSITILNDKKEDVEIFDEGFLSASTLLVVRNKNHKYEFLSWNEDEFIADLHWIITELEKIKDRKE